MGNIILFIITENKQSNQTIFEIKIPASEILGNKLFLDQ